MTENKLNNVTCDECKGVGRLGGSLYVYESCKTCKGSGSVERGGRE